MTPLLHPPDHSCIKNVHDECSAASCEGHIAQHRRGAKGSEGLCRHHLHSWHCLRCRGQIKTTSEPERTAPMQRLVVWSSGRDSDGAGSMLVRHGRQSSGTPGAAGRSNVTRRGWSRCGQVVLTPACRTRAGRQSCAGRFHRTPRAYHPGRASRLRKRHPCAARRT